MTEPPTMRMRQLAAASGVSVQTIHFYLREGLLPPPMKTAPNMAYYGEEYVEEIRLIKELQKQRYLPLSVIRLMLDARRQGKDVGELEDMRLSLEALFRPSGREPQEEHEPVGLSELMAIVDLPASAVETLEEVGLLMPVSTDQGNRYDGLDVRVARAAKRLLDLGLSTSDLALYRRYVDAVRTEAEVVRDKIFVGRGPQAGVRGLEVMEVLDTLNAALRQKVYREVATRSRPVGESQPRRRSD